MRSTFTGLNTMVRGIFANQLSLDTVGHNITNASTEGYSRQSVNLAATMCQMQGSLYGDVAVGTGVDSTSILRARNVYADRQYRQEVSTQKYNDIMQTNYERIETAFYDTENTGIQVAMQNFWKSWKSLSTNASGNAEREAVVGQGAVLCDMMHRAKDDLVNQMNALYEELEMRVDNINELTSKIVQYNKQIVAMEANGSSANDLRDQRDLVCDQLSEYIDISVSETDGYYNVVCDGATLVNKTSKLTLEISRGSSGDTDSSYVDYGVLDSAIKIRETKTAFTPKNGSIKGIFDAVNENKRMIDDLANMSAFLLTTFNAQHQAGYDLNGVEGVNFFGSANSVSYSYSEYRSYSSQLDFDHAYIYKDDEILTGIEIIEELFVNPKIAAYGGGKYIAAKTDRDLTGTDSDSKALGDNAVLLSNFFDMTRGYTDLTTGTADLYYNYYDADGKAIDIYYDRYITLDDGSTKELIYRGDDGVVYKVTPATSEDDSASDDESSGGVYYVDGNGTILTITSTSEESSDDSGGVSITFEGVKTTTNSITTTYTTVSYTTSSDGILIYSASDGQIYKTISADGTVGYYTYDDSGNRVALTRSTASTDSETDESDEDSTSTTTSDIVAIYSGEGGDDDSGGITFTIRSNDESVRALGDVSVYSYYNYSMSQLGLRAETMDVKVEAQDALIVQIQNWRASESGVDWNEELTNMIKFQKGYGACARCLTAMDEMLDRLVNNTGQVGR